MMKSRRTAGDGKRSKTRDKLGALAAAASTTIIVLQSTAFAHAAEIARPTEVICNDFVTLADGTQVPVCPAPLVGHEGMLVLGATFATLGAYRLRKARKGAIGPEGESHSS